MPHPSPPHLRTTTTEAGIMCPKCYRDRPVILHANLDPDLAIEVQEVDPHLCDLADAPPAEG